jgi:hypothetical protein
MPSTNKPVDAGPLAGPQPILAARSVVLRNGEPFALVPSKRTNHVRVVDLESARPVGTLLRSETLKLVLDGEVRVGRAVYRLDPERPLALVAPYTPHVPVPRQPRATTTA